MLGVGVGGSALDPQYNLAPLFLLPHTCPHEDLHPQLNPRTMRGPGGGVVL